MATKADYTVELKELLAQWEQVLTKQNALKAEYTTLSERIKVVCDALDQIARYETGR